MFRIIMGKLKYFLITSEAMEDKLITSSEKIVREEDLIFNISNIMGYIREGEKFGRFEMHPSDEVLARVTNPEDIIFVNCVPRYGFKLSTREGGIPASICSVHYFTRYHQIPIYEVLSPEQFVKLGRPKQLILHTRLEAIPSSGDENDRRQ
jgi:hypothetical protein